LFPELPKYSETLSPSADWDYRAGKGDGKLDYRLNMEQKMLKDSARDFFFKEFNSDTMRAMEANEKGYDPKMYRKMAHNGWLGLLVPEAFQGEGMSFLDMALILEEMGYAGYEGPFFTTAVTSVLLLESVADDKQKKALLPKIAAGKKIVTLAIMEPDTSASVSGIQMTASVDADDQYTLFGTKLFVPYAHVADHIICAVRTGDPGPDGQGGLSLFMVDRNTPGVKVNVMDTIARDKQCSVVFEGAKCSRKDLVGKLNLAGFHLIRVLQQAGVAKCAEMAGGARKAMKLTMDYAKKRVQFGRPITKFQAIQHHAADMLTYLDTARLMAYKTCWAIGQGGDCTRQAAICKAWVGEAYGNLVSLGHQILGGYGFMEEVDMQFFFRRAKAGDMMFGDSTFQCEIVAREIGL
jgi:alkylation response protein AidB-like acyl-CoA dehydrogenase